MRLLFHGLLVFLLASPLGAASNQTHTLDKELVAKLEPDIELPEGSYSLDEYVRYYWLEKNNEQSILRAEFRVPFDKSERAGEVFIGKPKNVIFDGGCSIINFAWDAKSLQPIYAVCNGLA